MSTLNLPTYSFKIKTENERKHIFDEIRRKYICLTPEEWVRQNFIKYLIEVKNFPKSLISVEMLVKVNSLSQRSDIVLHDNQANPLVIVECKATSVKIAQTTFDQIARYNLKLKVPYLIVTNGLNHYCCKMNYKEGTYIFLEDIPDYLEIIG